MEWMGTFTQLPLTHIQHSNKSEESLEVPHKLQQTITMTDQAIHSLKKMFLL